MTAVIDSKPGRRDRPGEGESVRSGRPDPAAPLIAIGVMANQALDEPLAPIGRRYEEHLIGFRTGPLREVAGVAGELAAKAAWLLGAAVPFQMDEDLPIARQQSAPSVGDGALVTAFAIGIFDPVLADPVVETNVGRLPGRRRQVNEELIGLELVDHVEPSLQRVLGPPDQWARVFVQPVGQRRRPPPREDEYRGAADPTGADGHAPGMDESLVGQPPQPVLTAPGSAEEQRLDLCSVEVAVIVECLEDGEVALGRETTVC